MSLPTIEFYINNTAYSYIPQNTNIIVNDIIAYLNTTYTIKLNQIHSIKFLNIPVTYTFEESCFASYNINRSSLSNTDKLSINLFNKIIFQNCGFDIPNNFFSDITSLNIIEFTDNTIKKIGDYAFYATNLTTLNIPNNLESIGNSAFEYSTIQTINTNNADSLKEIGNYAFTYMQIYNTFDFIVPASLEIIGNYCFFALPFGTLNTTNAQNLKSIGNYAFATVDVFQESSISIFNVPSNLETIGNNAFEYTRLNEFNITNAQKLKSIGNNAFKNCTYLTTITIPSTVEIIGNYCFKNTNNLTDIYFNEEKLNSISISTNIIDPNKTICIHLPVDKATFDSYTNGIKTYYKFISDT